MKFVHRISFRATPEQIEELEALGVKLATPLQMPIGLPLVAFDVAEDQTLWPRLRALLQQWDVGEGWVRTEFSWKEIDAASWLELGSAWHHGYPQPNELDFGYLAVTYDLTEFCVKCGAGTKQKGSFRMKREPRWGRNGILQLNWVFDEFFVTPEVWSRVFEKRGIGRRPVLDVKGNELRTVVQLICDEEVDIVTEGLPFETCEMCRRVKYLPDFRGPFPTLTREPSGAMARTRECFGSGGKAFNGVLVSQELARSLVTEDVRGFWLKPVRSSAGTT